MDLWPNRAGPPHLRLASRAARFLIVEARYYESIGADLLAGATRALEAAGATYDLVSVTGALEIPAGMAITLDAAKAAGWPYDGAVALGCVVRGETFHFEIVAGKSARALMDMSVERRLALGNGILTTDTIDTGRGARRSGSRRQGRRSGAGGDRPRRSRAPAQPAMKRSDQRSAARLAASQALYQMEVAGKGVNDILAEFEAHWIGREIEGDAYTPAELAFFRDVVSGVLRDQLPIDRGLDDTLAKGWPLQADRSAHARHPARSLLRTAQPPGRAGARRGDGVRRRRRRLLRPRGERHDQRRARRAGAPDAAGRVRRRPIKT